MSDPKTRTKDGKLLGDLVADAAAALGLNKVAAKIEQELKFPCGCSDRQQKLNNWHRELRQRKKENGITEDD